MNNPTQHRSWILGIRGRVAGGVLALAIMLVPAILATGSAQAQSWFDNFESYPLGTFPSPNWQASGNNGTSIVNSTYVSPDQSVQMYGIVGGCWGALIHRELQVSPPYTIQFYAGNGNESLSGCHPFRADGQLNAGPSWTTPGRWLAGFDAKGALLYVSPSDESLLKVGPVFPLLTWVQVQITYEFLNAKTVRIGYWLNGQFYKSIRYTPLASEGQFAWLGLQSAEGTAWFDDVRVTSGLPILTTTTLMSSPNPSTYGQPVTSTAAVTSKLGVPPNGETVSFMKGTTVLGTGTLSGGSASFTTSTLNAGTNAIKAVYLSDANFRFAGSNSKAVSQVVSKATTTTTLTSLPNPSSFGQSVTFTASVTPQFGGTVKGPVAFYDGTTLLKTVSLSGGVAKYTTKTLTSGKHTITATYNGSTSFTGSSALLTQTVN